MYVRMYVLMYFSVDIFEQNWTWPWPPFLEPQLAEFRQTGGIVSGSDGPNLQLGLLSFASFLG